MITIRKILCCILMLFSSLSVAYSQECTIQKISLKGFRQTSSGAAKKVMLTEFPSFFFWNKNPVFNETVLRQDMQSLKAYCNNEGFFDAVADYTLKYKSNSVAIAIVVNEGLPYYVESVTAAISDNPSNAILNALTNKITLKSGEIFETGQFDKTRKEFTEYLKLLGYGSCSADGKVIIDRKAHTVSIIFSVRTGPLQFFGGTTVKNNSYVKYEHIIMEVTFKEGDKFAAEELEKTRQNIYGLNLFGSVTVNPETPENAGSIIPVEISVTEKKKRSIKIGIGYGTEDNFRTQGSWTRYYLSNKPRTLVLSAKNTSILSNFTASIAQPFFINRKTGLTGTLAIDREDITSYTNEKLTVIAKVDRKYSGFLNVFTAYSLEIDRPVNIKVDISEELKATLPEKVYLISGLLFGASYNSIKTLLPQNGVIYSLLFEPVSYLLGSEVDYIKGVAEGHNFVKLNDNIVVAARLKYGFILPQRETTQVPIFKRLFSGGGSSVRGYGFHEIGPLDVYGTPLGGNYLFEYSVELQQHLSEHSNLIVFVDAGEVYNTGYIASGLKYGTGLGIRYATPIGPLGFDIGFPVRSENSIDLNEYRLYFSLGKVF